MSDISPRPYTWVEFETGEVDGLLCRRYQRTVPLRALAVQDAVREACAACPQHGRNFSCPPYSPGLVDHVGDADRAQVICLRVPLGHLDEPDPALRQRLGFRQAQLMLADELLTARESGFTVAGCGPCPSCGTCSAAEGAGVCRAPDRRIFSLESLGVNVVELLRSCFAIDLEWGGQGREVQCVHAAGAVFSKA